MNGAVPLGVVALFVAVLAACGGANQPGYPVAPLASESKGTDFAPDFKFVAYQGGEALGGQEVWLSSLFSRERGEKKPIVLNFWAGACPPCRAEMPDLQEVYEKYQDRVLLIGLDVGPFVGLGSRDEGQALLKELEINYPAGTTFDPDVVRAYKVIGMPSTYFIKPSGEIVRSWAGLLDKEKLAELVEELLQEAGSP